MKKEQMQEGQMFEKQSQIPMEREVLLASQQMSSVLCAQADPMNGKLQQEHWLNDVKSYQMVEV